VGFSFQGKETNFLHSYDNSRHVYATVFVEMLALPMIHTAWITALAGSLAHA